MAEPKFNVGQAVRIFQLLDEHTNKTLIGLVETIREVDAIPNDTFNYYVGSHYMHEAELEVADDLDASAKATLARLPVIDDPIIHEALKDVGLGGGA